MFFSLVTICVVEFSQNIFSFYFSFFTIGVFEFCQNFIVWVLPKFEFVFEFCLGRGGGGWASYGQCFQLSCFFVRMASLIKIINDKSVCRTAPSTLGLLITGLKCKCMSKSSYTQKVQVTLIYCCQRNRDVHSSHVMHKVEDKKTHLFGEFVGNVMKNGIFWYFWWNYFQR